MFMSCVAHPMSHAGNGYMGETPRRGNTARGSRMHEIVVSAILTRHATPDADNQEADARPR